MGQRDQKLQSYKRNVSCQGRPRVLGAIARNSDSFSFKISDNALKWPLGLRDKVDDLQRNIYMQQMDNYNSSQITTASNKAKNETYNRKEKSRLIPQKFSKKTHKKIGFDNSDF